MGWPQSQHRTRTRPCSSRPEIRRLHAGEPDPGSKEERFESTPLLSSLAPDVHSGSCAHNCLESRRRCHGIAIPRERATSAFYFPGTSTALSSAARADRRSEKDPAIQDLIPVGARGFEPPTACSQNGGNGVAGVAGDSQVAGTAQDRSAGGVQASQEVADFRRDFTSPVLPPPKRGRGGLTATDAGDELLTVKEIAAELKVCTATVYKIIDSGQLPHARVLNSGTHSSSGL
jgi:excisionase family DNA binding protein